MTTTLDNVRDLAPSIAIRAPEVEAARCVPRDLVDELRSAGVFRMYVPRTHAGDELSPIEATRVIEEIARADASVGWVAAIAAVSPAFLCRLPAATFDEVYGRGPDVVVAGALVPRGTAQREDDGFRYTGQWPFASGCTHADFIALNGLALERDENGDPTPAGGFRMAVFPAAAVEIVDTWHVHGLRGTGSHDVKLDDHFVPTAWTGQMLDPPPVVRQALDGVPALARLGFDLGAVAVGATRGAYEDLLQIGQTRRSMGFLPRAAEDPVFQHTVGRIDAGVRSLEATYRQIIRDFAERIDDPAAIDAERAPSRASLAFVAESAANLIDRCYAACGTQGLYDPSPLGRRLRDIRALTQHAVLSASAFTVGGAQALGEPPPPGLF